MADFTEYDYQSLVDRATAALSSKAGWGDAYQSSQGQTLIELIADLTDHLHYMLERRSLEGFLDTARLRTSVIARASDLGYRHQRIRAHSGYLTLTVTDTNGDPLPVTGEVVIPENAVVTSGGRTFYVAEPATISTGDTNVQILVREGVIQSTSFDIDTEEAIFVDYSNIDEDNITVYSGGEEYGDVRKAADVNKRALSFLDPGDAYYDIKYFYDGMRIVFGDGTFGKQPSGSVDVYYATIDELGTPIYTIGTEFSFIDNVTDNISSEVYEYTLVSATSISGGSEEEAIGDIRANAKAYHRSNGRAVTNEDYEFWLKYSGIGDIVDAKCFGEQEFDSLVYNANNVYITYATESGDALLAVEKQAVIDYFENIKTTQAHIVLNQARNVLLALQIDLVKTKNVPLSNAQAYSTVAGFIENYMTVTSGSIGGEFQLSDLINALYGITITRNGIDYQLVDYVSLSSDVVVPFDWPFSTSDAFVEIDALYTANAGDEFVLNIENLTCVYTISDGQSIPNILEGMRDVVRELTPFAATVELSGIVYDAYGNSEPIEINPQVGYHLLIGADTPYFSKDEVVAPPVIGSSVVRIQAAAEELDVQHFYYASPAGRRPMIPLRTGTVVTFTAPTDTDVNVYLRTKARDASTETSHTTITAGTLYTETFNDDHAVIFEYVNSSAEDVVVDIHYPSYSGVKYGLRIKANDDFGLFELNTATGDISAYVTVDYNIQLPVADYADNTDISVIRPGSLRITDTLGNILLTDDEEGGFVLANGTYVTTGSVSYATGLVVLPKTLPSTTDDKYNIVYDQDKYGNVKVSSSEVISYITPPATASSTDFSFTELTVG